MGTTSTSRTSCIRKYTAAAFLLITPYHVFVLFANCVQTTLYYIVSLYFILFYCRMGKMDFRFLALSETTQASLLHALSLRVRVMRPQGVANTLHGLAAMQVPWPSLPPPLRECMQHELCIHLPAMNTQEVANSLYS